MFKTIAQLKHEGLGAWKTAKIRLYKENVKYEQNREIAIFRFMETIRRFLRSEICHLILPFIRQHRELFQNRYPKHLYGFLCPGKN
ncbi:MAG: hypothetical protein V8R52_09625 [Coprobacter fastidiosus]